MNLSEDQQYISDSGMLVSGFNCLIQKPTGSGKTFLSKLAIRDSLERGYRAIYLAPLRALADELYKTWQLEFAGYKVGVFTGDWRAAYPVSFQDSQLLIMTPERLDLCLRNWRNNWDWLPQVDLVVQDEAHLLGESYRGPRLECCLMRLLTVNPFTRVIQLSATLGNGPELADWIGAVYHRSDQRMTPLEWRDRYCKRWSDKPDILLQELRAQIAKGGKVLVFVQSRKRAEDLCELVREALSLGVTDIAYHHAGLDPSDRRRVEQDFRAGKIAVCFATSTLELGINMPASMVVLYDLSAGQEPLSVNAAWQRAGRAGRPGFDVKGEVLLIRGRSDQCLQHYRSGKFEPILSQLDHDAALAEQVVVQIACGYARTLQQLEAFFSKSLAAKQKRLPSVERVVTEMIQAGMLEQIAVSNLKATKLGKVAVRHMLPPSTVITFRKVLLCAELTFFDLLLAIASVPDCEPLIRANYEELDDLAEAIAPEASYFLDISRTQLVKILDADDKRLLAAIKMARILRAWTRTGDAVAVAKQANCYPYEVKRLAESADRLITALIDVVGVLENPSNFDDQSYLCKSKIKVSERLKILSRMVVSGFDEEVATLSLVKNLGCVFSRKLHGIGISDIEALSNAQVDDLVALEGVGRAKATQWINDANELINSSHSAFRYREEQLDEPRELIVKLPAGVEAYRLRRAKELTHFTECKVVEGDRHGWVTVDDCYESCPCSTWQESYSIYTPRDGYCKHILAGKLAVKMPFPEQSDPTRLEQARDLKVEEIAFEVRGGMDTHRVFQIDGKLACDCPDKAGYECKHNLHIRISLGDQSLLEAIALLEERAEDSHLDLLSLWLGHARPKYTEANYR